jgi:uncharacterized C2H2 Zn-finger protein
VDGCLQKLLCTANHKIWTKNRGYVRADELTKDDVIKFDTLKKIKSNQKLSHLRKIKNLERKTILYTCPHCQKVFGRNSYTRHQNSSEIRNCINCNQQFEVNKKLDKVFCSHKCYSSSGRTAKLRSERMKKVNPANQPESLRRAVLSWKKTWEKMDASLKEKWLIRFRNAPLHQNRISPNKLEKTIIDMNIPGLEFVGLGTQWVTFKTGKHKNPDFIVKNTNKVIEVGNASFWHPKDERDDVVECYREIGYECLYLTDDEIYGDTEKAKIKIHKFIYKKKRTLPIRLILGAVVITLRNSPMKLPKKPGRLSKKWKPWVE